MAAKVRRHTHEDIYDWIESSVDMKNRTMYISSTNFDSDGKECGVDSHMTEFAIKGLRLLCNSGKGKITVLMNNIGGDWFHGMAIYDAIRSCPCPVDIEVFGHAMSMGAVVLQAGRKRFMHPSSALMIHDGYADAGDRPMQSARNWSNFEDKVIRPMMYTIFAERSGHYKSYWKRRCSHDAIMTPETAVKFGLADKVLYPTRDLPTMRRKKADRKK
jgi:ATP-dependent protease ClpP protease subunit